MPNNSDYTYGDDMGQMEQDMMSGDIIPDGGPLESKDFIVQDLEYLQGMYPGYMKRLQEYVVSACDHLDYKNSPMYDEYPDRILINQICDSICSQILNDGILSEEEEPEAGSEALDPFQSTVEIEEWGEEAEALERLSKQNNSSWGPNQPWGPPWGPNPGPNRPWDPWGPPPGPKNPWGPWGPPPGKKPGCGNPWGPPCGKPWGPNQPWGPPWGPNWGPPGPKNNRWLTDVVSVLLVNEMHRRRCASGRCR